MAISVKSFLQAQKKAAIEYRDTWRIFRIMSEFVEGYQFLSSFKKQITILGSARFSLKSHWYKEAHHLGRLLAKNGYTTITGGGPGIMEAANKGAYEAGGESLGLNIQLPKEQVLNPYVKKSVGFHYFFTRKVMLTSPSQAFVFFPGGYGTLDELFDVLDAIENKKMRRVPVILIGKDFWRPLINYLKECSSKRLGSVTANDLQIFTLVNSAKEALKIIKTTKNIPFTLEAGNGKDAKREIQWAIFRIMAELVEGFEFLTTFKNDITILGTKAVAKDDALYKQAYQAGRLLGKGGFSVVTGGGKGIPEAANKGAVDVGADSIGIALKVNAERFNPYVKRAISFSFPFVRKFILTAPSLAFVVFPGGYGTLSETFKLLCLIQTGKTAPVPIIFINREFWQPLMDFLEKKVYKECQAVEKKDLGIFSILDKPEEIKLY